MRVPGPETGFWRSALVSGLWRPLAADERRAEYWVRHVRIGVLLSEVAAWAVVGYALLSSTRAHHHPLLVVLLAALVILASPLLLLLPMTAIVRDHRGALLFYCWSLADTAVIAVIARADGGGASPLPLLLFLTLAFMAAAYPAAGVVAMGTLMTAVYLLVCLPDVGVSAAFFAVVMGAFTMTCALASGNQWESYDQQVLLLRTQEVLAATDPLTGYLNRRAFMDRLGAVTAAADDDVVVCLVDLDGFKAVNDSAGHAAGDAVLRAVARAVAGAVREADTVARLGGDEFAVLARTGPAEDGAQVAERVRAAVAAVGRSRGVTASVGAAVVRRGEDVHDLLHRADTAMYRAKASGGDRVEALTA